MLIHLIPRLFTHPHEGSNLDHKLVDFRCDALGLHLLNDVDLATVRPYPNPGYLAACRKDGRKIKEGFLIETPAPVQDFTTTTRWKSWRGRIMTHHVRYIVLDTEMDAITENMVAWGQWGDFPDRRPEIARAENWSPMAAQPCMFTRRATGKRVGEYTNHVDYEGRLVELAEVVRLHTVERERVLTCSMLPPRRIPDINTAFHATHAPK